MRKRLPLTPVFLDSELVSLLSHCACATLGITYADSRPTVLPSQPSATITVFNRDSFHVAHPLIEHGKIHPSWDTGALSEDIVTRLIPVFTYLDELFRSPSKTQALLHTLDQILEPRMASISDLFFNSKECKEWYPCCEKTSCQSPAFELPVPESTHRHSSDLHAHFLKHVLSVFQHMLKEKGLGDLYVFSGFVSTKLANSLVAQGGLFIEGLDSIGAAHGILSHVILFLGLLNDPFLQQLMTEQGLEPKVLLEAFVTITKRQIRNESLWTLYIDYFSAHHSPEFPAPLSIPNGLNATLMANTEHLFPTLSNLTYTTYALALQVSEEKMQWLNARHLVLTSIECGPSFSNAALIKLPITDHSDTVCDFYPSPEMIYPNSRGVFRICLEDSPRATQNAPSMAPPRDSKLLSEEGYSLCAKLCLSNQAKKEDILALIRSGYLPVSADYPNPYVFLLQTMTGLWNGASLLEFLSALVERQTHTHHLEDPVTGIHCLDAAGKDLCTQALEANFGHFGKFLSPPPAISLALFFIGQNVRPKGTHLEAALSSFLPGFKHTIRDALNPDSVKRTLTPPLEDELDLDFI